MPSIQDLIKWKQEQMRRKNSKLKLHHTKDDEEELDFRQKYYDGTIAGLVGCFVESIFYANYRNK